MTETQQRQASKPTQRKSRMRLMKLKMTGEFRHQSGDSELSDDAFEDLERCADDIQKTPDYQPLGYDSSREGLDTVNATFGEDEG